MKPTIGRIVQYVATQSDKEKMEAAKQVNGGCNQADILPGIVVAVHGEDKVNLRVLADGNLILWKTNVLWGKEPGMWHLMEHVVNPFVKL